MDKLTDFGHTFQIKSISALMKNQTFLEQIHDILDEKHFDSDSLKWVVKECKKYFDDYIDAGLPLGVFFFGFGKTASPEGVLGFSGTVFNSCIK